MRGIRECVLAGMQLTRLLQLTREQLQEVVGIVTAHHRGTAAGPSGRTFEIIRDLRAADVRAGHRRTIVM